MARPPTWTYDGIRAGAVLGSASLTVDNGFVERWLRLYAGEPDTRPELPAGMAMLIVMRSYAQAVSPRPPGNVHASQRLTIHRAPRVGERLTTTVRCQDKEMKKGRRWVHLAIETLGEGGEPCYQGIITSIWAR